MLHRLAWKPADKKMERPKLNVSVYLAPAGRSEINARALVQYEVPCRWTDGAD